MGTVDQPECGAGRASPAKWSNTNTGTKSSENVGRWAVGCNLVVLKNDLLAIRLQSSNTLFSAARTSNSRCLVLWSKDAMRVSFYFERSCPEHRPRAALKPKEPHSSGPWTPGAPAEVLASRESWSRDRGVVASGKPQELPL
jgi:hypothetical protein